MLVCYMHLQKLLDVFSFDNYGLIYNLVSICHALYGTILLIIVKRIKNFFFPLLFWVVFRERWCMIFLKKKDFFLSLCLEMRHQRERERNGYKRQLRIGFENQSINIKKVKKIGILCFSPCGWAAKRKHLAVLVGVWT